MGPGIIAGAHIPNRLCSGLSQALAWQELEVASGGVAAAKGQQEQAKGEQHHGAATI